MKQVPKLTLEDAKLMMAAAEKKASEILEDTEPDLAVFDLMMENEDSGFILCYKMKRRYPNVPIILATAVTSETGSAYGQCQGYLHHHRHRQGVHRRCRPKINQRLWQCQRPRTTRLRHQLSHSGSIHDLRRRPADLL